MDQIFIVCVLRQKSFIVCDFTDISCKFGGACADLDLRIHMTGRRFCDMSVKYYTIEQKSRLAISLTLCFIHSLFTYLYAFSFHGPEQVIGYPSHLQQKTLMDCHWKLKNGKFWDKNQVQKGKFSRYNTSMKDWVELCHWEYVYSCRISHLPQIY